MNTFKKLRIAEIGGISITMICLLLVLISNQSLNIGIMALLLVLAGMFLTIFLMRIRPSSMINGCIML